MKKLLSVLLTAAVLLCGLAVLAERDGSEEGTGRFTIPRIKAPTVPPIEVPEIDEIEVPKVPTAAPTKKPKIEVPEIPGVDVDLPQATPEAPAAVESALAALGVTAYRALYDAVSSGEAVGDGSRGDAATGLQQLLVAFGQDVRVDGIAGPKTLAALNAVQAQYELPQTDRLDAAGLSALLPLLLAREQPEP